MLLLSRLLLLLVRILRALALFRLHRLLLGLLLGWFGERGGLLLVMIMMTGLLLLRLVLRLVLEVRLVRLVQF